MIGPITPKASNDHRFIFVVIDYFTKWVEAALYASVTKAVVVRFIKKEIICRYGLPERIISDNGLNLNNNMVTEVCTRFKIKHHNSVPYQEFIKKLIEQFEDITFKHLPRKKNYLADALATLATMFKVNANVEAQLVNLEVRESQTHCACIQEEPDENP